MHQAKETTKKVYNNIINSINLYYTYYRICTILVNSEDSKTFDPYRLLLNLTDKINLEKSDTYVVLSNLSIYYTWKNI